MAFLILVPIFIAGLSHFVHAASFAVQDISSSRSITMNFDEVVTWKGLADLPLPYNHLEFFSFSVFAPKDPALSKYITEKNWDCAVSPQNALVGSRDHFEDEGSKPASFGIANATSMAAYGLSPYFTLSSFYVKPINAPPPGTTISLKGYSTAQETPLEWHIDFLTWYNEPFLVNIHEYSGVLWEKLSRVEIWADFDFDERLLDWEFCIDNLSVQFDQVPGDHLEPVNQDAARLHVQD